MILPAAPGVFRTGIAGPDSNLPTIVRDSNNLIVTASNPVHRGDSIIIYLTGMGQTNPASTAGLPAPSSPLAAALIAPQVDIGGVRLNVSYAGLSPGEIGVYQINVSVPRNVPLGLEVPLNIGQSGSSTTINVRVVE